MTPADILRHCRSVTRRHSKTFFLAASAFPPTVRDDVFVLYAFVRTADDLVDHTPPLRAEFDAWQTHTHKAFVEGTDDTTPPVITAFHTMCLRRGIPYRWVKDFFASQRLDLETSSYPTFADLERFIYGVAEVIGLMMCRIMSVPEPALEAGRLLGKSMQLINIVRDIPEDFRNGRVYIPQEDLRRFGLTSVIPHDDDQRRRFAAMLRFQLDRYEDIRRRAAQSFPLIPPAPRRVIMATDNIYRQLAAAFRRDPLVVLRRKVKPSRLRILTTLARYLILPPPRTP